MASIHSINGNPIVVNLAENADVIAEVIEEYLTEQSFDVSSGSAAGVNTDIMLAAGVPATIRVDSLTFKGGITMLVEGHSTPSVAVNHTGVYTFTPEHNGNLRFYFSGSGAVSGSVYAKNRFDDTAVLISDIVRNTPAVQTLQIKKNVVFDSVTTHEGMIVNASSLVTIENYESNLAASSVQSITEPIRVRDVYGVLVYKNLHPENATGIGSARAMVTFDKEGKYLRQVSTTNMLARSDTFLEDEYFAILSQYSNYPNFIWVVGNVNIEWLNQWQQGQGAIYHVGQNGDWQTFTEMLIALENDASEKTVYVEGGVYDIFEEMGGAEYIASISDPSILNWRDVCHVVPPNTTIIGVGDVTLQWLPESSVIGSRAMAYLFSPLNLSGSCHIENITVKVKNGRYAIHDETSNDASYNGATRVFKNVRAIFESGSDYDYAYAYGAGHNKNMKLLFENCYFESKRLTCWSTHDHPAGLNEASSFTFNNCIFKVGNNDATLQFISSDKVGRLDKVRLNGCSCAGVQYRSESRVPVLQGYEITAVGCHELSSTTYGDITVDTSTQQYLTIPSA